MEKGVKVGVLSRALGRYSATGQIPAIASTPETRRAWDAPSERAL